MQVIPLSLITQLDQMPFASNYKLNLYNIWKLFKYNQPYKSPSQANKKSIIKIFSDDGNFF